MTADQAARPIVIGYDGSPSAEAALRWAVSEATRTGRPLRVVHAHWFPFAAVSPGQLTPRAETFADGRVVADNAVSSAKDLAPGLDIQTVVHDGYPAHALIQESVRAELVVVGARGHGGFAGLLIGSVSHEVAAHAHCPVVVVRALGVEVSSSTHRVLVGVDGSHASDRALDFAFGHAAAHGLGLFAVQAWTPYYLDAALVAAPMLGDWRTELEGSRDALRTTLTGWRLKYPDVAVEERAVVGPPADVLVRLSKDAALLVVGSRGRGEIASLVLGSVSHSVLHRASCPVAVVRRT